MISVPTEARLKKATPEQLDKLVESVDKMVEHLERTIGIMKDIKSCIAGELVSRNLSAGKYKTKFGKPMDEVVLYQSLKEGAPGCLPGALHVIGREDFFRHQVDYRFGDMKCLECGAKVRVDSQKRYRANVVKVDTKTKKTEVYKEV